MTVTKTMPAAALILGTFLMLAVLGPKGAVAATGNTVYVIPVSGTVSPAMASFLKRAFRDIDPTQAAMVVLEMDTFGGRLDAAYDIVDTLLNPPVKNTVAFVDKKAISAGALIALACSRLVMKPHATIGDCAPIVYSTEGPQMMGEKFQSPLRAKFRTLARRNGYPVTLAESMVTAEMEVIAVELDGKTEYMEAAAFRELDEDTRKRVRSQKTVVGKGELLTMDDLEAERYGFSSMSVASIEQMLAQMQIDGYRIQRMEETWSEDLVRFISSIAPILILIGLAALYTEMKAPGFGLPGIVGIAALALVFLNQYLVGLADHTELLLLAAGVLLMAFELFVLPGFGIAGILGLLVICAGLILALQDFTLPDPELPWQRALLIRNAAQVLGACLVAFLAALGMIRYVLPGFSRMAKGPYLESTLQGAASTSEQLKTAVVGDVGTAVTLLRPSGKIKARGVVLDVVAEGQFIQKGARVKIIDIRGNRIIVAESEGTE